MNLTEHFTLEELTKSSTAVRLGIDNSAPADIQKRLDDLCENVLEPLRKLYGKPITVSSGYRSPKLNKAVGGAATSQHQKGEAADIHSASDDAASNKELWDVLMKSGLPFDQAINEYGYDWIHVSYHREKNRRQRLKAVKKGGRTSYLPA